jgi:hypothetical protein
MRTSARTQIEDASFENFEPHARMAKVPNALKQAATWRNGFGLLREKIA